MSKNLQIESRFTSLGMPLPFSHFATADLDTLEYVFISNSDCLDDVNMLADMIREEFANAKVVIGDIGPVIGAHTGPGAIALCYLGNVEKGVPDNV